MGQLDSTCRAPPRSSELSLMTQSSSVRISNKKGTPWYTANVKKATGPVPSFMNSVWCCDPSRYPVVAMQVVYFKGKL
jgi:hypothetical protein